MIGLTTSQQDDVPIDTSLRSFQQSFGLQPPIGANSVPVKRLGLNGATKGRYFEFPPTASGSNDIFYCDQSFKQSVI